MAEPSLAEKSRPPPVQFIKIPLEPPNEPKPPPVPQFLSPDAGQSQLHSVTFLSMKVDSLKPRVLACSCGYEIRVDEDWYTEIFDGTLMCHRCSSCTRCGLEGCVALRRLVSLGGFILCYDCLKHFGEQKSDEPRLICNRGQPPRRSKRRRRTPSIPTVTPKAQHNTEFYTNWWDTDRSPECRQLIRFRGYNRPKKQTVPSLDATLAPPKYYTATMPQFDRMICPACKSKAQGKSAYVVPAISMVYHRSCFRCVSCKSIMSNGIRVAGLHFVFCSCELPQQWCTRPNCVSDRIEHHAKFKCHLEPLHPGGRQQMDPRLALPDRYLGNDNEAEEKVESRKAASVAPTLGAAADPMVQAAGFQQQQQQQQQQQHPQQLRQPNSHYQQHKLMRNGNLEPLGAVTPTPSETGRLPVNRNAR